jgi:hypothetical protein
MAIYLACAETELAKRNIHVSLSKLDATVYMNPCALYIALTIYEEVHDIIRIAIHIARKTSMTVYSTLIEASMQVARYENFDGPLVALSEAHFAHFLNAKLGD